MAHQNTTRTALLEKSLRLFAAQGYEGVGVQQICNDAGVGKPTLYHYFGSKLGLLETLLEERLAPLHAALEPVSDTEAFDRTLVALAQRTFDFAREEPLLYRFYLTLWFAPIDSEARQAAQQHHQRHFEAIDARFRTQELAAGAPTGRHRMLAASFLGMLNNHIGIALNSFATLNARSASETVGMFLDGALSPAVSSDGE
ncbi:TetR/AcrR family transcriptional regulator [Martelella lutilitoris]|nr:TetR/AcrR family transcriptional regulator [Martelella lutilitoris]